jgi:hypothetical protein
MAVSVTSPPSRRAGSPCSPPPWPCDGVVVVPAQGVEDVLVAGRARAEKEEGLFEALTNGATTVELLGLDPSPIEMTSPPVDVT